MREDPYSPGDDSETDRDDLPSRSDLRRERQEVEEALMRLAKDLVLLGDRLLTKLELPETVIHAVLEARGIKNGSSKNRAMRQVRTAIRGVDAELIQNRLKDLNDPSRSRAPSRVLGVWRDRLVTGGEDDLSEFLRAFPSADRQQFRQLLRNARKAPDLTRAESLRVLTKALRVHLG
jgi:ribosome-associated protein